MLKKSGELVPVNSAEADSLPVQSGFSPVRALRGLAERRKVEQEARMNELTGRVVGKLIEGIVRDGMVSVFHDRATGELGTELYTGFFSSKKIRELYVTIWRWHKNPGTEEIEGHKRHTAGGLGPDRLSLDAYEHKPDHGRAIDVINCWDEDEGVFHLLYRGDTNKEGHGAVYNYPISDKIAFLEQILGTAFDHEAMVEKWGAPYTPGDTWSTTDDPLPRRGIRFDTFVPGSSEEVHNAYWVRDIYDQLPALPGYRPELEPASPPSIES